MPPGECHTALPELDRNASGLPVSRALELIRQHAPVRETLSALCSGCVSERGALEGAFILARGNGWEIIGPAGRTADAESLLSQVDLAALHSGLLNSEGPGSPGVTFERGWARPLVSGIGELLGLYVHLQDGPGDPPASGSDCVDTLCRLAVIAIEQGNMLEDLGYRADHDSLTGLFSRSYCERLLSLSLKRNLHTRTSIALMYINLDRFRLVNDVLGQRVGNFVLEEVARRFESKVRKGDMVARTGGDEFAVLMPAISSPREALALADRLLDSMAEPLSIQGHQLFVSASIGIGCSGSETTPSSLEREAYVALYHAKMSGKARHMLFDRAMATTPPERLEMEKRLRFALEGREMLLYYQPQLDLRSGKVVGAEVLLRWRQDDLGIVSPAAFIPILEETGLIADFGRWVLREACRQGAAWINAGESRLRLAVNVSAYQFQRGDFVENVQRALSESGFPPSHLELELTESLFVGDFANACRIFTELRAIGVTFALDDFGTGQSSLSYLQNLSFERLKIDQAFVRPIHDSDPLPPIVENILRLSSSLGMTTIAEGVETPHQAELLKAAHCQEGQGFVWSRPLPPERFIEFCRGR